MIRYKRIAYSLRKRVRSSRYRTNNRNRKKPFLFPILYIFVLALIICEEIIFLDHYQQLLSTCENVSTDLETFRNLEISDQVLHNLWKNSMGNQDSFVRKITMNMLLNNFSMPDNKNVIESYWYYWDKLIPESLYENYYEKYNIIFRDLVYFPVAKDLTNGVTISFEDSWMKDRTYGGQRGHEGTDIMAGNNQRGYFPVVSMTDGIVEQKGWLEMGGYRIGVRSASGAYFYYAHLDSYAPDLEIGDTVTAGQFLGMMGDTGYSKIEGTTGNFDVHLHVGIYIQDGEEEISLNPYWVLLYLEPNCVSWSEN